MWSVSSDNYWLIEIYRSADNWGFNNLLRGLPLETSFKVTGASSHLEASSPGLMVL